jgi:hypothetical protein
MPAGARRSARREVTYGEQGLRLLPLTRFGNAARYWRIKSISVSGTFLEMSEVQFCTDGTRQTGTLTSSDTPGLGAVSSLNDNVLTTRCYWSNAVAVAGGFWIKMDLGSGKVVNGIKLGGFDTANRYPTAFTLERSTDDSSWTVVASVSGLSYPGNNTLSGTISF